MIWYKVLFSIHGRIDRRSFWYGFGINFLWLGIISMIVDHQQLSLISVIPLIISLMSIASILIKRLHDRNRSGKNILILLLALLCYLSSWSLEAQLAWGLGVGLPVFILTVVIMELGFFKGHQGSNAYGEQQTFTFVKR